MLSLIFFIIINIGELYSCGEPINLYFLQHQDGLFQAEDIVYINCNFCGASNPVEVIIVDKDKPMVVRIPLLDEEKKQKDLEWANNQDNLAQKTRTCFTYRNNYRGRINKIKTNAIKN